jgi:bifunctional non-homologous end joining protein LigD
MARPSQQTPERSAKHRSAPAALKTYRAKRDFSKSPEPVGGAAAKRAKRRFFCIQKHLASHLHYDFRLEHRGVLLSWAVPKGPSLDPAVKRLAMQVEDHPLEYGTFEGVIPSGYGAGIVVLWDRGVWQPLDEDVDAALERGNLPFVVLGEKLAGAWTLIRASRAGPNAWLLVKQRDEWAGGADVTQEHPGSVASGGISPRSWRGRAAIPGLPPRPRSRAARPARSIARCSRAPSC